MKNLFSLFLILFLLYSAVSNAQISSFPYVQTGDALGWNVIQGPTLWYLGPAAKNPNGATNDPALICNFFGQPSGVEGLVVSPAFNFTSLSKPILHFYEAHRTYSTENDSLFVLISTDAGVSFNTVLSAKSNNGNPSLSTLSPSTSEFNPSSESQWRHETIDLSAYAGMNNIAIGFRGVSDFGNNLWIDNFIITNADAYCGIAVTSPSTQFCDPICKIDFNTIGNPGGGVVSITQHNNQLPVPSVAAVNIATNNPVTGATTHDGSRFTPNIIAPDSWFSVSYTGNDKSGYANYDISIDLSTYVSVVDITKLYVMKRSDLTGSWICLNTTAGGSSITASGLTTFSDFAVGGDSLQNPLPVELSSFTSFINRQNVTLKWSTASELNNSGFDIERSEINGQNSNNWINSGSVSGNGTSSSPNTYEFTDRNLASGKYIYRLKQIDFNGNHHYYNLGNEIVIGIPEKFELSQNYPNPFNPSTTINYQLTQGDRVTLKVFDLSGKEISTLVNEKQEAGYYSIKFDGTGISSGIYFYRITSGNFISVKRMILVK
ncbi:MAG: T9SS type A sorting domain-containing protein [Ignavibacteria bacterium]